MEVAIPHSLGREEARRRLRENSHQMADSFPGGMAQVTTRWSGEDRLEMAIAAMGHLGDIAHADVQAELARAAAMAKRAGKPCGIVGPNPDMVERFTGYGYSWVAVGSDMSMLVGRAQEWLGKLRGQALDYLGIPVVVTWHPAYLLRDPSHKRETWDDIKRVNRLLGLPDVPQRAP